MNTITIEDVNINLDEVVKHDNLDSVKAMELFPEGPNQEAAYDALWQAAQEVKNTPPEVKVSVGKIKKKS
jgi:hypothetical protein